VPHLSREKETAAVPTLIAYDEKASRIAQDYHRNELLFVTMRGYNCGGGLNTLP